MRSPTNESDETDTDSDESNRMDIDTSQRKDDSEKIDDDDFDDDDDAWVKHYLENQEEIDKRIESMMVDDGLLTRSTEDTLCLLRDCFKFRVMNFLAFEQLGQYTGFFLPSYEKCRWHSLVASLQEPSSCCRNSRSSACLCFEYWGGRSRRAGKGFVEHQSLSRVWNVSFNRSVT